MMVMSGFLKLQWRKFSPSVPAYILLGLSFIVIASYVLASLMIRPNGDDYGWLDTYNQASNWFSATYNFMQHDNGRYAQNLSIAIPYGIGGIRFLLLTGIISMGVFLASSYTALRALQKLTKIATSRLLTLGGACLFILAYTSLSLTYAGIRGEMDNTFQNFLWYAGFITYTFPVLLLIWLSSLGVLYKEKINANPKWLIGFFAVSVIAGLYGETGGVLYFAMLVILSCAWCIKNKNLKLKPYLTKAKTFITIAAGALTGLIITYTSPASSARREIIKNEASLTDIVIASMKGVKHFLLHNLIPSWKIFMVVLCVGAVIALILMSQHAVQSRKILKLSAWGLGISLVCGVASLFIAFVSIFKGYGIGGYIVPRFEIFYNIWFISAWICLGALLGCLLLKAFQAKFERKSALALSAIVLSLTILCLTSAVLHQAATRTKKIAVYSQQWDDLNTVIETEISQGQQTIYAPTIDIGDGYGMPCGDDLSANWLGATKANYYDITLVCTPGHK